MLPLLLRSITDKQSASQYPAQFTPKERNLITTFNTKQLPWKQDKNKQTIKAITMTNAIFPRLLSKFGTKRSLARTPIQLGRD